MAIDPPQATFKFKSFKVPEFKYVESPLEKGTIKLEIVPTGKFFESKSEFQLEVRFRAFEEERKEHYLVEMTTSSIYSFNEQISFEEIPPYFYQSALAITFPFIRSFISTFTAQADVKRLVIGLLNLTVYNKDLKEATTLVSEAQS